MEDDYVRKMSDEVDMEVDMDNEFIRDEDIHKDYGQEIGKIVDCSKTFITSEIIILCQFVLKILYIDILMLYVLYIAFFYSR